MKTNQTFPSFSSNSHDIKSKSIDLEKRETSDSSDSLRPHSNMISTRLLLLSAALISTILLVSTHQAIAGIAAHPKRLDAVSSSSSNHVSSSSSVSRDFKSVTAPSAFPTSAFSSYYQKPTGTLDEPRPVITDVARHSVYPDSLDNPTQLPTVSPFPVQFFQFQNLAYHLTFFSRSSSGSTDRRCSLTQGFFSSKDQRRRCRHFCLCYSIQHYSNFELYFFISMR